MVKGFSYFHRSEILQNLQNEHFDIVIIGGGITGAGIALDAASRGLRTALIEKNDFASGTSSKSTKLIHGGLRYLKQLHFKMVADVGRERRIVHKLAPHLVIPEKMLLPVFENGSMGICSISLGLKLYDWLAGVRGDDRRKMLGRRSTLLEEPLLPPARVKGSGLYAEYRTDDARLTIEIIKTANDQGAVCMNYARALQFLYTHERVSGVECEDEFTGTVFKVHGKYIINAAGPWVDDLRSLDHSLKGKELFITKGVHLVVPWKKLPVHHSMYFEIPDGRMIFLVPRDKITYIGTTDTPYDGDKDRLLVSKKDAVYLLNAVNDMLPNIELVLEDVESSWAGLRPLIFEEGKSVSEISRKDEVFISQTGLISIAGGKLTGYRLMAKKVVDMVSRKHSKEKNGKFIRCKTLRTPLSGNSFNETADVQSYTRKIQAKLGESGISSNYAPYLVHNYGIQVDAIMEKLKTCPESDPELRLLKAELSFCLEEEMVCKPLDFIERRSGRLFFWIHTAEQYLDEILDDFKIRFGWTEVQYEEEKNTFRIAFSACKNFQ